MENQNTQLVYPSPGFGSAYGNGWRMMTKYFLELLLISLAVIAATIPMGLLQAGHGIGLAPAIFLFEIFGMAYGLLIIAPLDYASQFVYYKAMKDEKFEFKELLSAFSDKYLNVILANLLTAAIVITGFILLIVPGIIFACKLVFVPYLVMDKNLDPVEAVKKSWSMTNGYGWTIFAMGFVSFFIIILGVCALIIGVIPATMWISSAFASLYHQVDLKLQENNK